MVMVMAGDNRQTALDLAAQGLFVFPVHSGGDKAKQPMPFIKWKDMSTNDPRQITAWWDKWPDAAPAVDCGKSGKLVVDADRKNGHDGVEAFGDLMAQHGFNPDSAPIVATPGDGNHHWFSQPAEGRLGNSPGALPAGVDVRGIGGYVVGPGAVMSDGKTYELYGDISSSPQPPQWLVDALQQRKAVEAAPKPSARPEQAERTEIEELLAYIPPDVGYHEWVQVAMAIHAGTNGAGFDLFDAWSAKGLKYPGTKVLSRKWSSFKRDGITVSTLAEIARMYGANLSEIAVKHRGFGAEYDPVEAAEAAKRLVFDDNVVFDEETGEIFEKPKTDVDNALGMPPGLVGRVARWILSISRRPQPNLAIGAALSVVGTAAGRHVKGPTDAGTALYVLGLCATGKGKETPLKATIRLLMASGMSQHIGPDQWMSMSALVKTVENKAVCLCPQDEFGSFMERIFSRRASTHERAIPQVLRSLWGTNFGVWVSPEWATGRSFHVEAPHLTLLATSTHEQFYSAVAGTAISDGTLNRFLLIEGTSKPEFVQNPADSNQVPQEVSDGIKAIFNLSGPLAASQRNTKDYNLSLDGNTTTIGWCPDGSEEVYATFQREMDDGENHADLAVRSAETAVRIATILAVGQGHDTVRKADIEYGIQMVRKSMAHAIHGSIEYMAENDYEAQTKKLLRFIAKAGRVSRADITRQFRSIKPNELGNILASLVEDGTLRDHKSQGIGRVRIDYSIKKEQ